MKEERANLQFLYSYKFNTKFYRAFSKSIRAKLNAVDRDTFIKFCVAIGMIIHVRNKKGDFDYFEFKPNEDLGRIANLVVQPSDDLELGINLTTGEAIWILPKDDQLRQGQIDENNLRCILQYFEKRVDMFFYKGPIQAMADYYYDFTKDYDGYYDEEELFEQMGFRDWVIAGECYETKFGVTEFFYELRHPDPIIQGMQATYICPLIDSDGEDWEEKHIVYSFDDCKTLFRCSKLSDFQDQNQLKQFYLDLHESFTLSLY